MYRLFLILFLLLPLSAMARAKIYLIPEVELSKGEVMLSDIARIEDGSTAKTTSLLIPDSLYNDLIIDHKELNNYLARKIQGSFTIFGSGVKLNFKEPEVVPQIIVKEEKMPVIKKGEIVKLIIRKGKISIEMAGKALKDCSENEEINIRLNNGKVFRGKAFGEKLVTVSL